MLTFQASRSQSNGVEVLMNDDGATCSYVVPASTGRIVQAMLRSAIVCRCPIVGGGEGARRGGGVGGRLSVALVVALIHGTFAHVSCVSMCFVRDIADPPQQLADSRLSIWSSPRCQPGPACPIFLYGCDGDKAPVECFSVLSQQYVNLLSSGARGTYSRGGPARRSRVVRATPCFVHRWAVGGECRQHLRSCSIVVSPFMSVS